MHKINLIGIGFRPLDKKAGGIVLGSDVVLANRRLVDVFSRYDEYRSVKDRIIVHGSVYEMLDYIADNYRSKKIALLAAGDPMFFGIGRLIAERFGQEAAEVYPDLSSIQVAFARAKETSNNAFFMSLHGGPDPAKRRKLEYEITDVPSLLRRHGKVAILTDKENSPEKIARVILKSFDFRLLTSDLKMYVCEKLGYDDEKITEGSPEEIAGMSFEHPNVVILKSAEELKNGRTDVGTYHNMNRPVLGLRENEIEHSRGLITKDEIRAVTMHKLRLPEKGVLWDIGAGSGAVSIEASRLCPGLRVYAIEKSEEQQQNIQANLEKFRVCNAELIKAAAPAVPGYLPSPDRVFIGGSSESLNDIIRVIGEKMSSGIVIVNAATIETLNEAVQYLKENGFETEVVEVSVSRSKRIGNRTHMSALNPVFIVKGER